MNWYLKAKIAFALLVWSCASCLAVDQDKIDAFIADLRQACEAKNTDAIKNLYYFNGAAEAVADEQMHQWEVWFRDDALKGPAKVDTIEFAPKEEYLSNTQTNTQAVATSIEPKRMNDHIYGPNLEVLGFVTVRFKRTFGTRSMMLIKPVGIAPGGAVRFTCDKKL